MCVGHGSKRNRRKHVSNRKNECLTSYKQYTKTRDQKIGLTFGLCLLLRNRERILVSSEEGPIRNIRLIFWSLVCLYYTNCGSAWYRRLPDPGCTHHHRQHPRFFLFGRQKEDAPCGFGTAGIQILVFLITVSSVFHFQNQPWAVLWGLCALRHGIQISMEAILACHPARSKK